MNYKYLGFSACLTGLCLVYSHAFADSKSSQVAAPDKKTKAETLSTPNATPNVDEGYDFFLHTDFIYWTARQDGLQCAAGSFFRYPADPSTITSNQTIPGGNFQYPDWKFYPGFKVGIGMGFPHGGWDLSANYTWLSAKANDTQNFSSQINSAWLTQNLTSVGLDANYLQYSKGTWGLHFNSANLELGRDHYLSRFLTSHLHLGLTGAWMKQHFNTYYTIPPINPTVGSPSYFYQKMHQTQKFWGVGIRTGLDVAWLFNRDWSIFGKTAFSALWGEFDVDAESFESSGTAALTTNNYGNAMTANMHKDFHSIKAVLELNMGFRWDRGFCDDHYRLRLEVGWEEQIWFNQNQFIPFTEPLLNQQGDLILQGLTVLLRFDF